MTATLTPADPVADNAGNITMPVANFQAYKKALIDNVMEFNILNQFTATRTQESNQPPTITHAGSEHSSPTGNN